MLHHWNDPSLGPATTYCDTGIKNGALAELDAVLERGVGVVAATTFNAGILVSGAKEGAVCNYRPATEAELERVRSIQHLCDEFSVPLPAAAIQFSLAHPAVASLIAGFGSPTEVESFSKWVSTDVPDEFWIRMKSAGFIHPDAPTGPVS